MSTAEMKNSLKPPSLTPLAKSATLSDVDSNPTIATISAAGTNTRPALRWFGIPGREAAIMLATSTLVLTASYVKLWNIGVAEAWGFVTGGICVWLVVRKNVWNWPVGLANNIFFFILFFRGRLYADMSLQLVYLALGIYGWQNWVFGGQNRTALPITRTKRSEWWVLVAAVLISTWVLMEILIKVNGAAPLWDSLTTVLSLAAQYLLCRKRFENWFFWIAADLIYVPLYFSRQLPLTAVLYGVFLCMCLVGVRQWNRTLKAKLTQA